MIRSMVKRLFVFPVLVLVLYAAAVEEHQPPRPLQLPDILAWKYIPVRVVSNDGQWFAYRLAPNEGDAEVVLRNLRDGKEQRFPIGEVPRPDPSSPAVAMPAPSRELAFSEDSQWFAMLAYPNVKESKLLRKQRKPVQSKLVLVELKTGNKTEFEKVRRFAFSGERSSAIAMHRYGSAPPAPPPPAASGAPPADDRPTGSDLILRDLASGTDLNLGNVSEFAFDKKGDWLAWLIDAQDKAGNGLSLRNMGTGAVTVLDSAKAVYKSLSWTEKGDGLATLRGVEDKAYEDKLYSLVAFKIVPDEPAPVKVVYDPAKDEAFPKDMTISANRTPFWMADLSAVVFGISELKKKKDAAKDTGAEGKPEEAKSEVKPEAKPKAESAKPAAPKPEDEPEKPDLVVWHWKDDRLQSMQQVQERSDRNFSFLCVYRPSEEKFLRLADESLRRVSVAPEHRYAMGADVREYERMGNLDGRRFQDVYVVDLKTGERRLALKKARWVMGPSPDGTHFLYYNDGAFYTYDMASGRSYNITAKAPAVFWDTEADYNVTKPPTRVIGWSKDASAVLVSDNWDIWKLPVHGGEGVNLTVNGKKDKIRYRARFRLDPEEKGIDLTQPMYVSVYGEYTKKGGIGLIEPDKTGVRMLHWDDASYFQLVKAKKAETYLYTRETNQEYPNYYVAGASLENGQKVTDANPQQRDFAWMKGSRVIDYTSAKGDKLQATLYLPAGYEEGKSYPTIVYIYERLTQSTNTYWQPTANGFNVAAYTSNGYAVLTPDIKYRLNDPGMSAVWCVLSALKAAVATGVVDPKRVGIHGHSWGGYQTAFLVTQTDAFAAAVAGAPLTNLVSMYSSIYWNSGSTNQPIFESSQGRFTGGYWENTEAYIRNSPVYHARNVKTPLMIMHNDKDGAVDWTQGIEYYNTLRRLGKPVVMLQYKGENHGLRKPENMKDYTVRMREFFNHYLKGEPAPKWLTEGVPLLKMADHLEERLKEQGETKPASPPKS